MKLPAQRRAVRAAQAEVAARRAELATPAANLAARAKQHPLTSLGVVAGIGFVLGDLRWPRARTPASAFSWPGGVLELAALLLRATTTPRADGSQADASSRRASGERASQPGPDTPTAGG